MNIKIKQLPHAEGLDLPYYATVHSAGMDLMAAIDSPFTLLAGESAIIPIGIIIALEDGFEAQIRPRSGLAAKNQITVLNSPGTIDSDYRGEIKVILINHSKVDFIIERGMRIAQMVIAKFERVSWIAENFDGQDTLRSNQGFGSTGIK